MTISRRTQAKRRRSRVQRRGRLENSPGVLGWAVTSNGIPPAYSYDRFAQSLDDARSDAAFPQLSLPSGAS